jgi:hypothetical protein
MKFTANLLVTSPPGRFSGDVRSRRLLLLRWRLEFSSIFCTRAPQGAPFFSYPPRRTAAHLGEQLPSALISCARWPLTDNARFPLMRFAI